ncbi:Uu.00g131890.m01.CDS01 [Anthostomella pinea]|uniref:Phosphoinositide phospholipase C n=1 Tax=Anthostomella pinea TaxID=933095 RepID=A0AAI8VIY7_9PEZI|nr:Uu.00g131890.m01.CDS01 [Anthostomella pinea]
MAETAPLPPNESLHQAGGGQSGAQDRIIQDVNAVVMPYLERVFNEHRGKDQKWEKDIVKSFMHHGQAENVTDAPEELDFAGFLHYMTSSAADVLAPPLENDLSWPLSSYYISSSHNTYLTGNQLNSDSDADAYKNVLLRGCRCVEIDVWDGDDSDLESSASESDDSDLKEKKALRQANRKASRKERLAASLPSSLTSRLQKTSLGRKLTVKGDKPAASTTAEEGDGVHPTGAASLEPSPTPHTVAVEPRVLHGYTLTKEVSFRKVCEAIRDNAFVVSDLPLIVSLEVHCCHQQQESMVAIMKQTWPDLLLPNPQDDAKVLPPPGELRRKILVKVKYTPPNASTSADDEESHDRLPPEAHADPKSKAAGAGAKKAKKAAKIIQALSAFGVYTRGVSFKSLSQPEASMPTHVFSVSENGVADLHESEAYRLFNHNRQYMMRTYPSGMRIGSSNLDPPVFWRKGIQIVALNWQKWDEGMMLNEGMFAGTGGFVLKPEGYRGGKQVDEHDGKASATAPLGKVIKHQTLDLQITVLAAQNLPMPEKDDKASGFKPYLKVELHTEPPHALGMAHLNELRENGKAKGGEYKAKTKTQRGVNPDFNGETLEFTKVGGVVPELAFVRFLVKDDELVSDDLAAWACVRLDRLRNGYRFVHLFNRQGEISGGVVLIKVEKSLA